MMGGGLSIGSLIGSIEIEDRGTAALQAFEGRIGSTVGSTSGLTNSVSTLGSAFNTVGFHITRVGDTLTLLTAPLTLAAGEAIKLATAFEFSMTKIANLTDIGTEGIDEMRTAVLRLSPEMGKGPAEIADALYSIGSVGFTGAKAIDVLTLSLKASAIGMGSAHDIAKTLTAVVLAYGEDNITAAHAADVLMSAVKEGGAEADEFANTLGRIIAGGHLVGVSFEELTASVATFTRLGVPAREAVTAFRGELAFLTKPSAGARAELHALGTSMEEVRDKVKKDGLADALISLWHLTGDNIDVMAKLIPNVRALAGTLSNVSEQADTYRDTVDKASKSTGILDEAFGRVSETAQFKFSQALAKLQVLGIDVGSSLLPTLVKVVEAFIPVIDAIDKLAIGFTKLPDVVQTTAMAFGALVLISGPVMGFYGRILYMAEMIGPLFLRMSGAVGVNTAAVVLDTVAVNANAAALERQVLALGAQIALATGASGSTAGMMAVTLLDNKSLELNQALRVRAAAGITAETGALTASEVAVNKVTAARNLAAQGRVFETAATIKNNLVIEEAAAGQLAYEASHLRVTSAVAKSTVATIGNTGIIAANTKTSIANAEALAQAAAKQTEFTFGLSNAATIEAAALTGATVNIGKFAQAGKEAEQMALGLSGAITQTALETEVATGVTVTLGAAAGVTAAAIGAVFVGGVVAAAAATDKMDALKTTIGSIPDTITTLGSIIKSQFILAWQDAKVKLDEFKTALMSLGDFIKTKAPGIFTAVGSFLQSELDKWAILNGLLIDLDRRLKEMVKEGATPKVGKHEDTNLTMWDNIAAQAAIHKQEDAIKQTTKAIEIYTAKYGPMVHALEFGDSGIVINTAALALQKKRLEEITGHLERVTLGTVGASKSLTPFTENLRAAQAELTKLHETPERWNDLVTGIKSTNFGLKDLAEGAGVSELAVKMLQDQLHASAKAGAESNKWIEQFQRSANKLNAEVADMQAAGRPAVDILKEYGAQIENLVDKAPRVVIITKRISDLYLELNKALLLKGVPIEPLPSITKIGEQVDFVDKSTAAAIKRIDDLQRSTRDLGRVLLPDTLVKQLDDVRLKYKDIADQIPEDQRVGERYGESMRLLTRQMNVELGNVTTVWERHGETLKKTTESVAKEAKEHFEAVVADVRSTAAEVIAAHNSLVLANRHVAIEIAGAWAQGLSQIGQATGGILGESISAIGGLVGAWGKAQEALIRYQNQVGGATTADKVNAITSGAAGIISGTSTGGTGRRMVGGAIAGMEAGMGAGVAFAGVSMGASIAAGALIGLAVGFMRAQNAETEFHKAIKALPGGLAAVTEAANTLGIGLREISSIDMLTDAQAQIKNMVDTMARYNLTWKDFNSTVAQTNVNAITRVLATDFRNLTSHGADPSKVIAGMSGSLSQLIIDAKETGTTIPITLQPMIEQMIRMGKITDEAARSLLGLGKETIITFDKSKKPVDDVVSAAQRYGLQLDELGSKVSQLQFTETANIIIADFEMMTAAGIDFETLMKRTAAELLVDRYTALVKSGKTAIDAQRDLRSAFQGVVSESLITGRAVPLAMKPILQQMLDAGLLTDQFGKKLENLNDINFADTFRSQLQAIVTEALLTGKEVPIAMKPILQKMIDAGELTDGFGTKLTNLDSINFVKPLTLAIDELIAKIGELIDKWNHVGDAAETAGQRQRDSIAIGTAVPRGQAGATPPAPPTPPGTPPGRSNPGKPENPEPGPGDNIIAFPVQASRVVRSPASYAASDLDSLSGMMLGSSSNEQSIAHIVRAVVQAMTAGDVGKHSIVVVPASTDKDALVEKVMAALPKHIRRNNRGVRTAIRSALGIAS